MSKGKEFLQSDVRRYFRVLLAVDSTQVPATVYSLARETGYTRSFVQRTLIVATQQFGIVLERTGATYKIIDWGVLNRTALMAFVGDENANNFNKNRYSADRQGEEGVTKGIYRIDDEIGYNYGWFVCLNRASGRFNLMFRDNIYGGKESALIAAQDWYDKKVLECPIMPRVNRVSIIRKNNQSGMAGVYRWPADGRLEKNAYWAAKWVETAGTKPVAKKFSISRYGEDVAKLLAIAARENALACCID